MTKRTSGMQKACQRMALTVGLLLSVLVTSVGSVVIAQSNTQWSENYQLIADSEPDGNLAKAAVDRQGRVHVLWVSAEDEDIAQLGPNAPRAIVYRRLENGIWTTANDVLATSPLGPVILGAMAIDDQDYLNVLWFDQGRSRDLYFSRAHTSLAESAVNWTTITLETPQVAMGFPHLVVENDGFLHVVYPLDNRAIVYVRSSDYGQTWTNPETVFAVTDPFGTAIANPRIAVDDRGGLHLVWTEVSQTLNWGGLTVNYANSRDRGQSWDIVEVQRSEPGESTVGWINVVVRNGREIHLAWNRGVGSRLGRYHSWSSDYGTTWTNPVAFMPEFVSGQTKWPLMEVDNAGVLHLITVASEQSGLTSPKYTFWDGSKWSSVFSFSESSNDLNTEFTIGLGNTLHLFHPTQRVTETDRSGGGKLLYNWRFTDAPPVAPEMIMLPAPTPTPDSVALSIDGIESVLPTVSTAAQDDFSWSVQEPGVISSTSGAIMLVIVASLAAIVPVTLLQLRRQRHR